MGKFLTLTSFFIATPIVLIVSLILSLSILHHDSQVLGSSHRNTIAFAALPTSDNLFEEEITAKDGRVEAVRAYLTRYNSPLEPHADFIVKEADTYGIDYRLVPAIAMKESSLCKKIIVSNAENNCWGFGIHGTRRVSFDDYNEGITTVTKWLAEHKENGLVTPQQIMQRYNPTSPNGSWAIEVAYFMSAIASF
jgi:hypothetical protein